MSTTKFDIQNKPNIEINTLGQCMTFLDGISLARVSGVNLLFSDCANKMHFWKTLLLKEVTEYPKLSSELCDKNVKNYKDLYKIAYSLIFALNKSLQSEERDQLKLDKLFFKVFRYGFEKLILRFSTKAKIDLSRPILETQQTFLHIASSYGHDHIVKFLLEQKHPRPLHIEPLDYSSAMTAAVPNGGSLMGIVSDETPLHKAAHSGHLECMKLLISAKANLNFKNHWGETALHLSASSGHVECVKFLITKGAHLNCINCQGNMPIHLAKENSKDNCVDVIKQAMTERNISIPSSCIIL